MVGAQAGKSGLPKAQNIRLDLKEPGGFTDFE